MVVRAWISEIPDPRVDGRVALATFVVALLTGILFGLSPALHATRVSIGDVLKSSTGSSARSRSLQQAIVVAQVALTQPLLVGLGVIIVTMTADLGSDSSSSVPERIAEIELDTWSGRVSSEERASRIDAIVARIAGNPEVVTALPMEMGTITAPLTVHADDRIEGRPYAVAMEARLKAAPPGYFETFDMPIVRGRDFVGAPRIAVVRMFFVRGVALSAVGLVLGLPLAVLAIRLVMGWLGWSVDVPPLLAAAVAAGVLGVAAVAAWIPARRPSAVDPVVTLGSE